MIIEVYKGFSVGELKEINEIPLLQEELKIKKNPLLFDKSYSKRLAIELLSMEENSRRWVTYEEFSLIRNKIEDDINDGELKVVIYRNNIYPDVYPLDIEISSDLYEEIQKSINTDSTDEASEECRKILSIYNSIIEIDGIFFGSMYNYEYDNKEGIEVKEFYPNLETISEEIKETDYNIFLNEDIENYLRDLCKIKNEHVETIGVSATNGIVSKRLLSSLRAFAKNENIKLCYYYDSLSDDVELDYELVKIAKEDINIKNFKDFKKISFYKDPDFNSDLVEISQAQIIKDIIKQAEKATTESEKYRDLFITASTGAGKSVMFQIPAIYLAKHYNKLTIIIEPVKSLMQDQKDKLLKNGYKRVETFNSDLNSQIEKEAVIKKIKDGEIDLLYLSPETLLAYSLETIIGDREIGLLIVDEAHIVTTWGVGFRPDYWYLGTYINRLRNSTQTQAGKKRKTYRFPVCAFTATAINGGEDDSVSDTIISLYMENPIKYIGNVRRTNIKFDINIKDLTKLPKDEYEKRKTKCLDNRLNDWLDKSEKSIVYFPYANLVKDAEKGLRGFADITTSPMIGKYTGKNVDAISTVVFNEEKKEIFDKFKYGEKPIMYATKAFGMGVDVEDVINVYHYAVTGNLCDYVQEIGRAARDQKLQGIASYDYYYNDMSFTNALFGMSQIRQYQINKVLSGIYETYKNKNESRNFLISPISFSYLFKGNKNEECINKLKTCLMMLEKDLYDKYNFKVLISRPQSVFTKAFIVVDKEYESRVMSSKYASALKFVAHGRNGEPTGKGGLVYDEGDIYAIDLKSIWENEYPNMSFPQFKYKYFNYHSSDKETIMPEIRDKIYPRQRITVESRGNIILAEVKDKILNEIEYVNEVLYDTFGKQWFTLNDFSIAIKERYGIAQARIIANSLFDLADPEGRCIKHRGGQESSGEIVYSIANGNFKEYMRRPMVKSKLVGKLTLCNATKYSSYISLAENYTDTALKMLSIFDFISYEIVGGEDPEIFIRLNDPNKIKGIINGTIYYSNSYVSKAKQKHDRDVAILRYFFNNLNNDDERWDFIENYFLGYDVLNGVEIDDSEIVSMTKSIDKDKSYQLGKNNNWQDVKWFFENAEQQIIERMKEEGLPVPEFIQTIFKKSNKGEYIKMSWPAKDVCICDQDTPLDVLEVFEKKGWHAQKIGQIDYEKMKGWLL